MALRRSVALVALAPLVPALACGLDLVGTSPDAGAGASPEAGAADGAQPLDGAADGGPEDIADADTFEVGSTPFDSGVVDAGCETDPIDDPLSSIDPTRWLTVSNLTGYPRPERSGNTNILHLLTSAYTGEYTGLWLKNAMPMTSFDVEFTVYGQCGNHYIWDPDCADGMAAVWLDTTTPGTGALSSAASGSTLGIPRSLSGAGLALDFYPNAPLGDQSAPALEVLAINGAKNPATYPWVVKSSPHGQLPGVTHRVRLSARGGSLAVFYDDAIQFGGPVPIPTVARGSFGFTAATGSQTAYFYIWDFHAVFYDCLLSL
jgi:hypothetical protein